MLPVLVICVLSMQNAPALPSVAPPVVRVAVQSAPPVAAPAAAAPTPAPEPATPAPAEPQPTPAAPPPAPPAPAPVSKPGMIKVDAYHETARDSTDSNIWSAFNARQTESGPMEGTWIVAAGDGRKLVSLELRVDATSQKLEGAWRSLANDVGLTRSGFVSDLFLDGATMEINYSTGPSHPPSVLELRKGSDGAWHGVLLDPAGHRTDVVMSHAVHTG